MEDIRLIVTPEPHPSPARKRPPRRPPFRIGAVQHRWHPDPEEHEAELSRGIGMAASWSASRS
jgi:N-carbamoylputrescine amidase